MSVILIKCKVAFRESSTFAFHWHNDMHGALLTWTLKADQNSGKPKCKRRGKTYKGLSTQFGAASHTMEISALRYRTVLTVGPWRGRTTDTSTKLMMYRNWVAEDNERRKPSEWVQIRHFLIRVEVDVDLVGVMRKRREEGKCRNSNLDVGLEAF